MFYDRYSVVQRRLAGSVLSLAGDPVFAEHVLYSPRDPAEIDEDQIAREQAELQWAGFRPGGVPGTLRRFLNIDRTVEDFNQWAERGRGPRRLLEYQSLAYLAGRHINALDELNEILDADTFRTYVEREQADAKEEYIQHCIRRQVQQGGARVRGTDDNPKDPSHFWLKCFNLDDNKDRGTYVNQTDKNLSTAPIRLGMMNAGGDAVFLERLPVRRYSQGLTQENLLTTRLGDSAATRGNGVRVPLRHNKDLVKTVKGEYPEFSEAISLIAGGDARSVAFGRNLAVELDDRLGLAFLWYKKQKIGYTDDADRFKIGPNFRFLREELETNGVKINVDAA